MNIYIYDQIRKKFFNGYIRSQPIDTIILHGSEHETIQSIMNTPLNSKMGKLYSKGIKLYNYFINKDGKIIEIVPPDKWVWHAQNGAIDMGSIGICLYNKSIFNRNKYSDAQYESLMQLILYLSDNYNDIKNIMSHNRFKMINFEKKKMCPGKGFAWSNFKTILNYNFDFESKEGIDSIWNLKRKKI